MRAWAGGLAVAVGLFGASRAVAQPDPSAFLLPPLPANKPARTDGDDLPPPPVRRTETNDPQVERAASFTITNRDAGRERLRDEDVESVTRPRRDERPFNLLDYARPERRGVPADRAAGKPFDKIGEELTDWLDKPGGDRKRFQSDRAFDGFASPVTNPFLFEDPRSLTEVRPLFVYQDVPGGQPNFGGGSLWFAGGQARLAITDRISVTMNKLGVAGVNASNDFFGNNTGLSELWLGPKFVILRNPEAQRLVSAGAIFQIPLGADEVFQDTGSLSIVPYASVGQSFLKSRFGCWNALATAGYSFSTNKERSDYFYASGHLDFDVGSAHKFYPLLEVNWFQYTTNGTANFIAGEGRDLVNFGSIGKGSGLLTGAVGARYRFTNNLELGGAFEIPFAGNRDFFRYRFTLDLIWRY